MKLKELVALAYNTAATANDCYARQVHDKAKESLSKLQKLLNKNLAKLEKDVKES